MSIYLKENNLDITLLLIILYYRANSKNKSNHKCLLTKKKYVERSYRERYYS